MMDLSEALRIERGETVAFVGAGGKTTAMFRVAKSLAPAIVTTSTHLGASQFVLADRHILIDPNTDLTQFGLEFLKQEVVLITGPFNKSGDRLMAPTEQQLRHLHNYCKNLQLSLLIESDGSRGLSLKAPGQHEPAIPDYVDTVVVIAGLTNVGKPLFNEYVHRPEIFSELGEIVLGERISTKALAKVLTHHQGGLKNIPPHAKIRLVLSKAYTETEQAYGREIADLCKLAIDGVVICTMNPSPGKIFAVKEKIAGIILAGGGSSRFGSSKLLLEYQGQPFIRKIAETALEAGLEPVVVVTGKDDVELRKQLIGLPACIINNKDWPSGQSTTVKAGINALPESVGGAMFLLGDQPQISVEFIQAILERHSQTLASIVAPLVGGRRSNPVLFDRTTFGEFSSLTGDAGGRQIFNKFQVDYLEWLDGKMLIDVDTPEDYQKLLHYDQDEKDG